MRVIKSRNYEIEITCSFCGSDLAYEQRDIQQDMVIKNGEWYYKNYIVCPVCGEIIGLSYENAFTTNNTTSRCQYV